VKPLCLAQIRLRHVVEGRPLDGATEAALNADGRPGARAILDSVNRRRFENRSEGQRLRRLLRCETALWSKGVTHVAGVDEAGMSRSRAPWRQRQSCLRRARAYRESMKLHAASRDRLAAEIKATAVTWSVAFASVEEIDAVNIYWASRLAMHRAIDGLGEAPEHVLIDGRHLKGLAVPQQAMIRGDAKSLTIAAASILAKTARDAVMCELDICHPGYGFARHKGYPVAGHRNALHWLGACPIHRRSSAPVRSVLGLPPLPPWPANGAVPDAHPGT
jgi:ribonuclease HII